MFLYAMLSPLSNNYKPIIAPTQPQKDFVYDTKLPALIISFIVLGLNIIISIITFIRIANITKSILIYLCLYILISIILSIVNIAYLLTSSSNETLTIIIFISFFSLCLMINIIGLVIEVIISPQYLKKLQPLFAYSSEKICPQIVFINSFLLFILLFFILDYMYILNGYSTLTQYEYSFIIIFVVISILSTINIIFIYNSSTFIIRPIFGLHIILILLSVLLYILCINTKYQSFTFTVVDLNRIPNDIQSFCTDQLSQMNANKQIIYNYLQNYFFDIGFTEFQLNQIISQILDTQKYIAISILEPSYNVMQNLYNITLNPVFAQFQTTYDNITNTLIDDNTGAYNFNTLLNNINTLSSQLSQLSNNSLISLLNYVNNTQLPIINTEMNTLLNTRAFIQYLLPESERDFTTMISALNNDISTLEYIFPSRFNTFFISPYLYISNVMSNVDNYLQMNINNLVSSNIADKIQGTTTTTNQYGILTLINNSGNVNNLNAKQCIININEQYKLFCDFYNDNNIKSNSIYLSNDYFNISQRLYTYCRNNVLLFPMVNDNTTATILIDDLIFNNICNGTVGMMSINTLNYIFTPYIFTKHKNVWSAYNNTPIAKLEESNGATIWKNGMSKLFNIKMQSIPNITFINQLTHTADVYTLFAQYNNTFITTNGNATTTTISGTTINTVQSVTYSEDLLIKTVVTLYTTPIIQTSTQSTSNNTHILQNILNNNLQIQNIINNSFTSTNNISIYLPIFSFNTPNFNTLNNLVNISINNTTSTTTYTIIIYDIWNTYINNLYNVITTTNKTQTYTITRNYPVNMIRSEPETDVLGNYVYSITPSSSIQSETTITTDSVTTTNTSTLSTTITYPGYKVVLTYNGSSLTHIVYSSPNISSNIWTQIS